MGIAHGKDEKNEPPNFYLAVAVCDIRSARSMGIRNRDYMKRPSDGGEERSSSPEARAEEFAQRLLARSRKLILIGGIILAILIIVALVMARFSGGGR